MTSYDITFAYGWGIEGITERTQWSDNIANFYPLTKLDSKFYGKPTKIPKEQQNFIEKFDSIVIINFGKI